MPIRRTREKASAGKIKAAENASLALKLRIQGFTYREIGERLGLTLARAHQIVTREFDLAAKELKETREAARQVELERLDAMLRGIWPKASRGNLDAIDRALRIAQRRARLQNLDDQAPASIVIDIREVIRAAAENPAFDQEEPGE